MIPFHQVCPQLAEDELRSIILQNGAPIPDDQYGLFEAYCDERDCDCRRVMIRVVSLKRRKEEAYISFGFDPRDPMRGPFLDPLNKQGPYATEILELVTDLLERDAAYVARLKRHYQIAKAISNGTLKPRDAKPSPRLSAPVDMDLLDAKMKSGPNPSHATKLSLPVDVRSGLDEPGEMFKAFVRMGTLAGFDMTTREGFDEYARVFAELPSASDGAKMDVGGDRRFFGLGGSTSRRPERDAKKRQRQARKRNRH